MPISLWISVSLRALMMAPDLTLARHAATYQAGMPTHNSSHATMVGPFHKANGVPAFIASASSSCLKHLYMLEPLVLFFKGGRASFYVTLLVFTGPGEEVISKVKKRANKLVI